MHGLLATLAWLVGVTAHAKTFEISVGTRLTDFNYAEELSAPAKSTESAAFASYLANLKIFALDDRSHVNLRYEGSGRVPSQYKGSDLHTNAPLMSVDTLQFWTLEATANLALNDILEVYVGYGHKNSNRFLSGNPGYREIYSWYYTPVGARVKFGAGRMLQWGLDVSIRPTQRGLIDVITSQTYPGGQDSQQTLGARTGYRVEVPLRWNSAPWFFTTSPFFEHSSIGQSNLVENTTLAPDGWIYEPNSHTDVFGLELTVGF